MGKPCIYLTTQKSNNMWYIGSHKDSDNIRNRAYMGSGTTISVELEKNPDDFNCEVLKEVPTRENAFDIEDHLLKFLDAAGNNASYNNTNNAAKPRGLFARVFGSRMKLSLDELNKFKEMLPTGSVEGVDSSQETIEDITEARAQQCYDIGFDLGDKYGIEYEVEDRILIQRNTMVEQISRNIHLREAAIERLKVILEHNTDDLSSKLLMKTKESSLKYFQGMLVHAEQKTGWYSTFDAKYREGIREGMRSYLERKIRLSNG